MVSLVPKCILSRAKLTSHIVDPRRPSEAERVVQKNHEIRCLIVEKVLPLWDFEVRIVEQAHSRDELTNLHRHAGTNGEPAKDVERRTSVAL